MSSTEIDFSKNKEIRNTRDRTITKPKKNKLKISKCGGQSLQKESIRNSENEIKHN